MRARNVIRNPAAEVARVTIPCRICAAPRCVGQCCLPSFERTVLTLADFDTDLEAE